jgi:hypothetical protein
MLNDEDRPLPASRGIQRGLPNETNFDGVCIAVCKLLQANVYIATSLMPPVSARPSIPAGPQAGSSDTCMLAAWRVLTRTIWRSLPHRTQLQPVSRFATACGSAPASSGPPTARPLAYPLPAPSCTSEGSAQALTRTPRTGAWPVPAAAASGWRPQLVLGIESSCDDTGVAIVSSDGRILGEALASQVRGGCRAGPQQATAKT